MSAPVLTDLKVLIVEDSPTQALLLEEALNGLKMVVTVARDGVEGLAAIQKQIPQVIISDIEMPNMNGYELCKQVKANATFSEVPFILLTSLSDAMDVIRGIQCGADSFMTKPFDIHFLMANISDLLGSRKTARTGPPVIQELDISFGGERHHLRVNQEQVTNLLLSTYSNAIQKNRELEQAYRKLNEVNQEIERKNEELKQLDMQKNQFLGMAAHDLRNPLNVMQGYSSLLLEKLAAVEDQSILSMLNRIQKSSAFMLQLINDLLDISSIESGKVTLNLSQVDLVALVKEIVTLESSLSEKKQIQLVFKCDQQIPQVKCDSDKIEQVITNLITNAIKYSNPQTTIEVSLTLSANEVIVAVKDQGLGIPANEKEKLFQPFTKTSVKSTAGEASTGLGLVIVKKIVTEHQGRIWVESEVGKGSTFFVALPINK